MAKKRKRATAKKRKRPVKKVRRVRKRVRGRVGARKVKRKPAKKRAKRKTVSRKATGRHLVKQVERSSVERVMSGKRKRRRTTRRKSRPRVVMAGRRRRGRSVGKIGSTGLLIGLGVGALALYLLTKKSTTTPSTYTLPPLTQTSNLTRNTQSSDIINYAIAGGLAIDAIIKLIDRLNTSTDQDVTNIYDHVNATGDVEVYV